MKKTSALLTLGLTALLSISGCINSNDYNSRVRELLKFERYRVERILEKVKSKTLRLEAVIEYSIIGSSNYTSEQQGVGFCIKTGYGDRIVTLEHIINLHQLERRTSIGKITIRVNLNNRAIRINNDDKPLEVIAEDEDSDLAILKAPQGLDCYSEEDFGNIEYLYVGKEIFFYGTPLGQELTLRKGIIGSLKGYEILKGD